MSYSILLCLALNCYWHVPYLPIIKKKKKPFFDQLKILQKPKIILNSWTITPHSPSDIQGEPCSLIVTCICHKTLQYFLGYSTLLIPAGWNSCLVAHSAVGTPAATMNGWTTTQHGHHSAEMPAESNLRQRAKGWVDRTRTIKNSHTLSSCSWLFFSST